MYNVYNQVYSGKSRPKVQQIRCSLARLELFADIEQRRNKLHHIMLLIGIRPCVLSLRSWNMKLF